MNKSEIAERAARRAHREIMKFALQLGCNLADSDWKQFDALVEAAVERAIAESQPEPRKMRLHPTLQQYSDNETHAENDDCAKIGCAELGDGEPSSAPPRTKSELIDWLAKWRQERGGSISEHNHRRLLKERTVTELNTMYQRIVSQESGAAQEVSLVDPANLLRRHTLGRMEEVSPSNCPDCNHSIRLHNSTGCYETDANEKFCYCKKTHLDFPVEEVSPPSPESAK